MRELSVLIPARNEDFIEQTIASILKNRRGDTEIIVFLDGYEPKPPIKNHPDVKIIKSSTSIGQRAAANAAAAESDARNIMKLDAHCIVGPGFDTTLMSDHHPAWTVVPSMYDLHAFDWECVGCGGRSIQGSKPVSCQKCGCKAGFVRREVFDKRNVPPTDYWVIDQTFVVSEDRYRRPSPYPTEEIMCTLGCCFFMDHDRFDMLGGLDEEHGSWGQMGIEIACKAWLSGGALVLNKAAWFAHLRRTRPGFNFPYKQDGKQIVHAHRYSMDLWLNDKWPLAKRPYKWLRNKFQKTQ